MRVILFFLVFSITASSLADHTCRATCIDAADVSYKQSGNNGPSYKLFYRSKDLTATAATKRKAWKLLKAKCGRLLVTSYKTAIEYGVGTILKSHEKAKKKTACATGSKISTDNHTTGNNSPRREEPMSDEATVER